MKKGDLVRIVPSNWHSGEAAALEYTAKHGWLFIYMGFFGHRHRMRSIADGHIAFFSDREHPPFEKAEEQADEEG